MTESTISTVEPKREERLLGILQWTPIGMCIVFVMIIHYAMAVLIELRSAMQQISTGFDGIF